MNFDDVVVGDVLEDSPFIPALGMDNTLLTCIGSDDTTLLFTVSYKGIKLCENMRCEKVDGYWKEEEA